MPRRTVIGLALLAGAAGCVQAGRRAAGNRASTRPVTASPTSKRPSPTSHPATTTPPATRSAPPRGPAIELAHGPRSRPEVALTFHGAGDPTIARELLGIFAAHRAQVTVLAVGTWLAANPEMAKEIVGAGHELGNHTWTHPVLADLGKTAVQSEIERCRDLIDRLTSSPGAHFRQSSAQHSTPLIRQVAGAAGYRVCLSYDIDSLDWTDPGPAAVRRNVTAARPGSVVSMHFGHPGTVSAMPGVLEDLANRGLRPVSASRLLRS